MQHWELESQLRKLLTSDVSGHHDINVLRGYLRCLCGAFHQPAVKGKGSARCQLESCHVLHIRIVHQNINLSKCRWKCIYKTPDLFGFANVKL